MVEWRRQRWGLQVARRHHWRAQVLGTAAILLASCGTAGRPPSPELVSEVLARPQPRTVRVIGYLTQDAGAVRLVGELYSGANGFEPGEHGLCLAAPAGEEARLTALAPGAPATALATVDGTLAPSDTNNDACDAVVTNARAELLAPRDATITALLERPQAYDGAIVRVAGGLLARPGAALLVERLGTGGVPAPGTRQIKLVAPLADGIVPETLGRSPGGDVRFGAVLVEGRWQNGVLMPLAISAVIE